MKSLTEKKQKKKESSAKVGSGGDDQQSSSPSSLLKSGKGSGGSGRFGFLKKIGSGRSKPHQQNTAAEVSAADSAVHVLVAKDVSQDTNDKTNNRKAILDASMNENANQINENTEKEIDEIDELDRSLPRENTAWRHLDPDIDEGVDKNFISDATKAAATSTAAAKATEIVKTDDTTDTANTASSSSSAADVTTVANHNSTSTANVITPPPSSTLQKKVVLNSQDSITAAYKFDQKPGKKHVDERSHNPVAARFLADDGVGMGTPTPSSTPAPPLDLESGLPVSASTGENYSNDKVMHMTRPVAERIKCGTSTSTGMVGTNFSSGNSSSSPSSSNKDTPTANAQDRQRIHQSPSPSPSHQYSVRHTHGPEFQKLHDLFEKNKSASVPKLMGDSCPSSPDRAKSKSSVGEIDSDHIRHVKELTKEWNEKSPVSSPVGSGGQKMTVDVKLDGKKVDNHPNQPHKALYAPDLSQ